MTAPQEISDIRRQLFALKSRNLELQDEVLAVKTDRADTVALLGQAELVLEGKIAYIIELDRALTTRIKELEAECDRKTQEIDNRGQALAESRQADQRNRSERDQIIADLSDRLEKANQETNRAHETAGNINSELTESVKQVAQLETELGELRKQFSAEQTATTGLRADLAAMTQLRDECQAALAATRSSLQEAQNETATARDTIRRIQTSALWRWSKPWRHWFGPKP